MKRGGESLLCGLWLLACSAPPQVPEEGVVDEKEDAAPVRVDDDKSRCDYKGRDDRAVQEASGPGAKHLNVRRVYRVVGIGAEQRRIIACREIDTNLDGVKDLVRRYDDKGTPTEEQADANYDGRIDTWVTFTFGKVAKVELDNRGDGRPDETRLYVDGRLNRLQRDTNGDGKPDVWEIYSEEKLERMGVDLDHDGRVDRWDRDAIAQREAEERKRQEEAQQKQNGGGGGSSGSPKNDEGSGEQPPEGKAPAEGG